MKLIYSPLHKKHIPPYEIFNGEKEPHQEVPARAENIKSALEKQLGLKTQPPKDFDLNLLKNIHAPDYLQYLQSFKNEPYEYPSVFQYGEKHGIPQHPVAQRGYYVFDLYTPLNSYVYTAAKTSALLALTAADLVLHGESYAYALCRPPGHHAEIAQAGGYCYINNAAASAEYLRQHGAKKVATLDVDIHHGNGTQHIFYQRSDVLTVSLHAAPDVLFPYFSGGDNEYGQGRGEGFNVNFPLPAKTGNRAFHKTLAKALQKIADFKPDYLVVSIGYDTHEADPIGVFSLTTAYYEQMTKAIQSLQLPTVIVQEGGYNTKKLGDNAVSFVKGFIA
ncbi:histone deacetylase family protein [Candidatus Microgenomates bacterium]|nr:MAG: histone deacetylase family protein [Candidatus Microgenomates bacterium]